MNIQTIYFGAGCFWGTQFYFDQIDGVVETEVGYIGGHTNNPTYEDVCYHNTGHAEVAKVVYDTGILSTDHLVRHFFEMHNPTQGMRQGPDVGEQYRSVIFTTSDEQSKSAKKVLEEIDAGLGGKVTTELEPAPMFWTAEPYHQKYSERTGRGMCHIDPKSVRVG